MDSTKDNDHVAEPFRSIVNNYGGDNKMANTPAEIYAVIRANALSDGRARLAAEIIFLFDREEDDAKALKGIFDLCKRESA